MSQVVFEVVQVSSGGFGTKSLVQEWAERRRNFTEADLSTELWQDFQDALELLSESDFESVHEWLDEQESLFLSAWEQYEGLAIMESEITSESVLCHSYLRDGIEAWLEAMACLRDTLDNRGVVTDETLALARQGQGYLVAVQRLEAQIQRQRIPSCGAYQIAA